MAERKIAPVSSNEDKSHTYRVQLGKYKRAVQNEFYFEALLIDYAMLEDRLRAMLYHMAFIAKRNDLTVWKKTRPYLQNMVSEYKGEKENDTLGLKNISGKIKLVRSVLLWVNNVETGYQNDKFLVKLKNQCESLDIGGILETLDSIGDWCCYRNEIIHGLLNKNLDSLDLELRDRVEEGMAYARFLDAQERILKANGVIRRSANAPKDTK